MAGAENQVLAVELERVEEKLPTLFERDDTFYSQVEKRPAEMVSSVTARVPLELRPGGKSGHFTSDGGGLGRGDMPTYSRALITYVELRHTLEWTTRRKWGVDSTRKATVNTFTRDLASAMGEFRRFVDSLTMTAGNAVLGTVTTVSTNAGVDTYTLTTDGFGSRLLRYGQDIQLWNSTLTVQRVPAVAPPSTVSAKEATITSLDGGGKSINVASFTAAAPGDLLVASRTPGTPPVSLLGVPYHNSNASVGSWLQLDRAVTPEIRANGISVAGSLTLPFPRAVINRIGDRLGIKKKSKLTAWMHPCQKQAYEELGFEVIRIDKSAREEGLDLYFNDEMRIAGAPVKCSFSWDKTRIDFQDMDVWARVEFEPIGWYKDENGNRYFVTYDVDGGVATTNLASLVVAMNMYVSNPGAIAYLDQLTVPANY